MDPRELFVRTSEEWHSYFSTHRNVLESVPWDQGRALSDDEKKRIVTSIQEFQLGESSEGKNLAGFAKDYSQKNGDPLYYESIKFFIREEQRHSQLLGRFMEREGISSLKSSFVDLVFRHLRRYAGLEVSLTVLLMAEIISLVYYRALRAATGSPLLKRICRELLRDERAHLNFHCERLAILRWECASFPLWVRDLAQAVLLSGTCLVVWANHWKVFSVSLSPVSFWRSVWRVYALAQRKIVIQRKMKVGGQLKWIY